MCILNMFLDFVRRETMSTENAYNQLAPLVPVQYALHCFKVLPFVDHY